MWVQSNVRTLVVLGASVMLFQGLAAARLRAHDDAPLGKILAPAFRKHCIKCHGAEPEIQGELDLVKLRPAALAGDITLLRQLVDVLSLSKMPPEDEPALPVALRRRMTEQVKSLLRAAVTQDRRFEHAPIRRMNRFQYNNAVIDLFDLKSIVFTLPERMMREHRGYFQPQTGKMSKVVTVGSRPLGKSQMIERRLAGVAAFPQDRRAENGFDNRGDHLSLSPLLMESFLKLGQSITHSPDFGPRNVGIWQVFFAEPAASGAIRSQVHRRLKPFLQRAFRRPVDGPTVDRYVDFVVRQLEAGSTFPSAMKAAAAAAISSPRFLYLYDISSQQQAAASIDDFELASRLSFFLWGSLPDQQLHEVAKSGRLTETQTLSREFDRMLQDRKLKRFCDSFPGQWLQLERLISSVPDRTKFPGFYFSKYRDSMHMMLEPLLLFETVLVENLSITQLIDSDFTYRTKLLDEAYRELGHQFAGGKQGGGNVGVLRFQRVAVADRRNGGVITNAAVMTMTSGPNRTQPITRGAWIAAVIFNDPPQPPPADVPPLAKEPAAAEKHLTLRERLALHRKRSDCRGCHERIDPLGFALENYNPIGVWRDTYDNGRNVDVSGQLYRKHTFTSVVEFKDAILAEKHRFAEAFAGHLLSFALARELGPADHVAIENVAHAAAADDYRIQTLLKQLVLSKPFLSKTNPTTSQTRSVKSQR